MARDANLIRGRFYCPTILFLNYYIFQRENIRKKSDIRGEWTLENMKKAIEKCPNVRCLCFDKARGATKRKNGIHIRTLTRRLQK